MSRSLGSLIFILSLFTVAPIWANKLTILSPHRKSIQGEFVPAFKAYYQKKFNQDIEVEWIDQGGTSDDVRFLRSRFAQNPASSGVDLFWGGGQSVFTELSKEGLLQSYKISDELAKEVPERLGGVEVYDSARTWYSQALSAFGIFYNRMALSSQKLAEPKSWIDLGQASYLNHLSQADPRRSGTAGIMNMIILQALGWEKGWEVLHRLAGNTRNFTHSSSDPVKAIVSGDAYAAPVADFYAYPKIEELGKDKLGFYIPAAETILNGDPIAILKGAPNLLAAQRFLEFSLSKDAQKLWLLPVGLPGGPTQSYLGRIAVNRLAYSETSGTRPGDFDPFAQPTFFNFDMGKSAATLDLLNDLMGALIIDHHAELRAVWKEISQKEGGPSVELMKSFSVVPLSEEEFASLGPRWKDQDLRNASLNKWSAATKTKFSTLQQSLAPSSKEGWFSKLKSLFKSK